MLITECINFGGPDAIAGVEILPKTGKYQDDRLGGTAAEYYYALMVSFARIAAADKRGVFSEVAAAFTDPPVPARADSESRRNISAKWAEKQFDALDGFVNVAPHLFPPELRDRAFLNDARKQCIECARYFDAAKARAAADADYVALTHINLQHDNGFFWREDGQLVAGLLDWCAILQLEMHPWRELVSTASEPRSKVFPDLDPLCSGTTPPAHRSRTSSWDASPAPRRRWCEAREPSTK